MDNYKEVKNLKSIKTKRYELKLCQGIESGLYYIAYKKPNSIKGEQDIVYISSGLTDYGLASSIFDEYRMELEGN
jgi:hypothetical protein